MAVVALESLSKRYDLGNIHVRAQQPRRGATFVPKGKTSAPDPDGVTLLVAIAASGVVAPLPLASWRMPDRPVTFFQTISLTAQK